MRYKLKYNIKNYQYCIIIEKLMSKSDDFKPLINERFTATEKDILEKNKKFFSSNRKYIDIMLKIINGESDISIRALDWFVSNYSKKNNTYYKIKINGKIDFFYVHNEYNNQLNGYSKEYFDPFCRKKKVIYSYRNNIVTNNISKPGKIDITFETSIGQLNFFQWAICKQIIRYVELHLKEIDTDMKETTKRRNEEKKMALLRHISEESSDDSDYDKDPDPMFCSSEKIDTVILSSSKKTSTSKSDSSSKRKKLSKSVYEYGIKKTCIPIVTNFD